MNRDLSAKELFAYSFARNMGTADRIFRVVSGLVLAAAGFALGLSPLASAPMAVAGLAWFGTGATSRCGVYYLLGYSTCPIRDERNPLKNV